MARVAGINIPDNKQVGIALTYVYGIGRSLALEILKKANINPEKKVSSLSEKELTNLRNVIQQGGYKVEGVLRETIRQNIKRLKLIHTYRGLRHIKGLPVRGQQTRTNSRTVRGNIRHTVATGRKAPPPKT